jgi:hypothetical protein
MPPDIITEEGFHTMLSPYGYSDKLMQHVWSFRPNVDITETQARQFIESFHETGIGSILELALKLEEHDA